MGSSIPPIDSNTMYYLCSNIIIDRYGSGCLASHNITVIYQFIHCHGHLLMTIEAIQISNHHDYEHLH